jgi:hypothetical protein
MSNFCLVKSVSSSAGPSSDRPELPNLSRQPGSAFRLSRPALELTQVTDPSWTAGAPPKAARPWSSPKLQTPHGQPGSAEGRPSFDDYLVPTFTNLRATVGDARVRHLSGLVVMEARATVGDSRVRTSCGPVGSNHLVDSSSDRSA